MNARPFPLSPGPVAWSLLGAALLAVSTLRAQPPPHTFTFSVQQVVPDGNLSGLADPRELPPGPAPIQSVAVTLTLSPLGDGGFFGDLYATLTRLTDGYAVLLNRPGRTPERPFGYSDGGPVQITLTDAAPADIHHYRLTLLGDETLPLNAPLIGPWQPDGRATDPLSVLSTDPRTATLVNFSGREQEGLWTLFVADVSTGGEFRLEDWSLEFTYIPEPASGALLVLGLGLWLGRRNSRYGQPKGETQRAGGGMVQPGSPPSGF